MSQAKQYDIAPIGEYVYVKDPISGGYIQVKTEAEGIVIDIYDGRDGFIDTAAFMFSDIYSESEDGSEVDSIPRGRGGAEHRTLEIPAKGEYFYLDIHGGGQIMISHEANKVIDIDVFNQSNESLGNTLRVARNRLVGREPEAAMKG